MSVSAIGSSFCYVPPERIEASQPGRSAEAEAPPARATSDATATEPSADSRPRAKLSAETAAVVIETQEKDVPAPASHRDAAVRYASHAA